MIKKGAQGSDEREFGVPFVCQDDPMVTVTKPRYCPFVYSNVPFVRYWCGQHGFTLIELMLTVVLIGVLLGIGVPNFRSFIQNSRITTQSNEVVGALATARSEAIKRNQSVVLCRSADPTATTPECTTSGTGTWESGWLLFQDSDGNNTFSTTSSPADVLLRIHEAIPDGLTLRANSTQLANYLTFNASGMTTLSAPASGDPPHHFKLCDSRGVAYGRAVVLETTGRARISRQSTFSSLSCP